MISKVSNSTLFILFALIISHIFILSRLIFFPYPELFVYPYLTNRGLIPYRDILDQHFPGLMFFPLNLDNLGMTTPEVARLWQYGVVIVIHLLLFMIAKRIFGSERKALITNLIYFIWQPFFEGWVLWIDSFMPIFLLPSFYFLYKWAKQKELKLVFLSGLFLGLAVIFKQAVLPLVLLVGIFILFKKKKLQHPAIFSLGFLIPCVFLVAYILKLDVWEDFIYWTVTFNLTTFAQMGRKYPEASLLLRSLFVILPSLIIFKRYFLLTLYILGGLAFAYARFDLVHLQPVLPFVVLGTTAAFVWMWQRSRTKISIAIYLIGTIVILTKFYQGHLGSKVFFFGESEKKIVKEVQSVAGKDDKIFTLGTFPHIYQMAARLPPGNVFVFQFPWFMIEAEGKVLSGIEKEPPRVVVRDKNALVDGKNLVSYMPEISEYIENSYKVKNIIDGTEILVRK